MAARRIFVVDDEPGMLEVCEDTLAVIASATVETEVDSVKGLERVRTETWDLLIFDIKMPRVDGVELLRAARESNPEAPVIMMTAFPTVETAISTMKLGALDYVTKPFIPDDLLAKVQRALEGQRLAEERDALTSQMEGATRFDELVGQSVSMRELFDAIERVAPSDTDVLVTGESGTGKELVARSLHLRSGRSGRFVPVDCGAIPENLFESELFGHERGAFTGASGRRPGLMELADKGTLFLDEIGELPPGMQTKLLRALQERSFRRVGGREEIGVDLRIVAATNRDLRETMEAGGFRKDLFYRLNVVPLLVPSLRERLDDVPLLFAHFLARYGGRSEPRVQRADPQLVGALARYAWPGNVRELQSSVRRMVAFCKSDTLTFDELPDEIAAGAAAAAPSSEHAPTPGGFFAVRAQRIDEFEREYLARSLRRHRGNVVAAAAEAAMPRGTFYRLLKKHGLSATDFRSAKGPETD
jgi:two-component system response regulator HydG